MSVSDQNASPGGRRELTKAQNRQTILAAARQVFAQMGYGAATVRDIIRATPLAAGTFYNYFKSKEEVYQAIRDEAALAMRPQLAEQRAAAATLEEFVAASFGAFFAFVHSHQGEFPAMRPDADQSRLRMDTREMIAGFEELRADLQLAVDRGLLGPVDCEYLTAAIAGVAIEIAERLLRRETGDPGAAAEFATALLLGGIKNLPTGP